MSDHVVQNVLMLMWEAFEPIRPTCISPSHSKFQNLDIRKLNYNLPFKRQTFQVLRFTLKLEAANLIPCIYSSIRIGFRRQS